eukprot:445993-Rhodomonas_salina.1
MFNVHVGSADSWENDAGRKHRKDESESQHGFPCFVGEHDGFGANDAFAIAAKGRHTGNTTGHRSNGNRSEIPLILRDNKFR